jgi:steroid delta-isomerase-like uncharacterized protein
MSNTQLHQEAHRRMSEEGAEQTAALFAPDIVYEDCARGLTMKGRDETTGWLRGWKSSFPDATIKQATYLEAGDWTVARFHGQGVNDGPLGDLPATGKQLDLPCCEVIRWSDGKAVEGAFYYDTATIMVQLGHMPAPTA